MIKYEVFLICNLEPNIELTNRAVPRVTQKHRRKQQNHAKSADLYKLVFVLILNSIYTIQINKIPWFLRF